MISARHCDLSDLCLCNTPTPQTASRYVSTVSHYTTVPGCTGFLSLHNSLILQLTKRRAHNVLPPNPPFFFSPKAMPMHSCSTLHWHDNSEITCTAGWQAITFHHDHNPPDINIIIQLQYKNSNTYILGSNPIAHRQEVPKRLGKRSAAV